MMLQLFIRDFCRLTYSIIICCCLIFELNAQNRETGLFSMQAENAQSISIGQTFTQSTTIAPFARSAEIYGLDLSADITLDHYVSLVRVILIDNTFDEYMVYEAYPRISGNNRISVKNICEETFLVNGIKPRSIKIEIIDGSITLHDISVSYTPHRMSNRQFDEYYEDVREKQIDEKIIALNNYISANGMNWTAERTEDSHLPYREKKFLINGDHIFNWQGFEYHTKGVFEIWYEDGRPSNDNEERSATLRKEFDWRNRHGANDASSPYYDGDASGTGWCSPIVKQSCAHCWAFTGTGTLECVANVWFNQHLDIDLSEQDAASCSGGNIGNCQGGYSSKTVKYIVSTGIADEECYKYTKKEGNCKKLCSDPKERIKASGSKKVGTKADEIKKAIILNGPITSGVRSMWHYMCLVGFKEDASRKITWIFKNSSGPTSGENGFKLVQGKNSDFYDQYILKGPLSNLNNLQVKCLDNDKDGYYNWGVGPKPSTCPEGCSDSADGNDNDPSLGPYDADFNEIKLVTYVTHHTDKSFKTPFNVYQSFEKETFYIDIKNGSSRTYTIELIDLSGRVLLSGQRKSGKSIFLTRGLASSIYFVRINSEGLNYFQKVLIR